jgi:hypothetical protein
MPRYKLRGAFWDGVQLHPAGSEIELAEGATPPPAAQLVEQEEAPEPPAKPAAKK